MQQDASAGPPADPLGPETTLVELLSRLFADVGRLLLQELALVRAELGASPPTLSVTELEDGIARTRARITHQLAVIDREYGLRHLLVHASRLARSADLRPGVVAASLRRDPLPFALIGAGIAWLALGRQDGDALGRLRDGLAHARNFTATLMALSSKTRPIPTTIALGTEGRDGGQVQPEKLRAYAMTTSFHVASLTRDETPLALPLIQATWRGTDLASWRSFVASFDDETAASGSGVLALRDAADAICGILAFRIDRDLRVGRVLAIDMFTAVDVANSTHSVRALLDTAYALAREQGCAGIQIRLSNVQPRLAAQLSALGLLSEASLLSKTIDPSPARN